MERKSNVSREVPERLLVVMLITWFVAVITFAACTIMLDKSPKVPILRPPSFNSKVNGSLETLSTRLFRALREMKLVQEQNKELQALVDKGLLKTREMSNQSNARWNEIRNVMSSKQAMTQLPTGPSMQYEIARRRSVEGVLEMWRFFSSQLRQIRAVAPELNVTIDRLLSQGLDHKRQMMNTAMELDIADGYASWRTHEALELRDLVQRKLNLLQNPFDCNSAQLLICSHVNTSSCDLACQLHHAASCLAIAYGTERTLIWQNGENEANFIPLIATCKEFKSIEDRTTWPGSQNSRILEILPAGIIDPPSPHQPPAVPHDIVQRLRRLHGDPSAWWVGQLLRYLLQFPADTKEYLESTAVKLGFERPIVSLYYSPGSNINENRNSSIEVFMSHVEEYYGQLEFLKDNGTRKLFVVSEDRAVSADIKKLYPKYEIIKQEDFLKVTPEGSKFGNSTFFAVRDLYFLSISSLLVCRFSVEFCRAAYELMQTRHTDASLHFRSLDAPYHFRGIDLYHEVVMDHKSIWPGEMSLSIGDHIRVNEILWNGYSKGENLRSGHKGLFPSHKTQVLVMDELTPIPTSNPHMTQEDFGRTETYSHSTPGETLTRPSSTPAGINPGATSTPGISGNSTTGTPASPTAVTPTIHQ